MILGANGLWLSWAVFVIVWIALAFRPARVAARKAHIDPPNKKRRNSR